MRLQQGRADSVVTTCSTPAPPGIILASPPPRQASTNSASPFPCATVNARPGPENATCPGLHDTFNPLAVWNSVNPSPGRRMASTTPARSAGLTTCVRPAHQRTASSRGNAASSGGCHHATPPITASEVHCASVSPNQYARQPANRNPQGSNPRVQQFPHRDSNLRVHSVPQLLAARSHPLADARHCLPQHRGRALPICPFRRLNPRRPHPLRHVRHLVHLAIRYARPLLARHRKRTNQTILTRT